MDEGKEPEYDVIYLFLGKLLNYAVKIYCKHIIQMLLFDCFWELFIYEVNMFYALITKISRSTTGAKDNKFVKF